MTVSEAITPFFIVGSGRSGTTLLRSLLSAHSRIAVTPETHFMKRARAEGDVHGEPTDFPAFWERLTTWVRFQDLGIEETTCLEKIEASGEKTFRSVFDAMLQSYAERVGKPRVGEKTPSHLYYLDDLLCWYPRAKVLAIQRDPRAVVASNMHTPRMKHKIAERSLRGGVFARKRLTAVLKQSDRWMHANSVELPRWASDPRVMLLKYERLVTDPEGEMRAVCNFLGEPFEADMLEDRRSAGIPVPKGSVGDQEWDRWRREHQARSMEPVRDDSLNKWRKQLSRLEVAVIESRCRSAMEGAGYEQEVAPVSQAVSYHWAKLHLLLAVLEGKCRNTMPRAIREAVGNF